MSSVMHNGPSVVVVSGGGEGLKGAPSQVSESLRLGDKYKGK